MHSRPMFPILETQVGDGWVGDGWVGDGWVGDVDYTKQATKQDSNFLVGGTRTTSTTADSRGMRPAVPMPCP